MNIWAIIGLIYAGLTVIMMTSFVVEHFFNKKHPELKPWSFRKEPALWVKLAVSPLVAWLCFFSIKKLFQILFYGKRAFALSTEEKEKYGQFLVHDKYLNKFVTIKEFNKTHKTTLTLDDVYGRGYIESLSASEKAEMEKESRGLVIEENLSDDIYTEIAKLFESCRYKRDFSLLKPYLANDVQLVLYGSQKTIIGVNEFEFYWKDRELRLERDNIEVQTTIKRCAYFSRTAIFDNIKGYKSMYTVFRIVDNKITHVLLLPNPLQDPIIRYMDLNQLPFTYEYIMQNVTEKIESNPNRIPCLRCGTLSEKLEWYKVTVDCGPLGYSGVVSVCNKCKKVVEFFPEILLRNDMSHEAEDYNDDSHPELELRYPRLTTSCLYFEQPLINTDYCKNLDKEYIVRYKYDGLGLNNIPSCQPCSLKSCAEECNVLMLSSLMETDVNTYNMVKECYINAFNDGIYEAANNIGILLANYEDKMEEGLQWLSKAASHGCHDAMQNYFSLLWSNEEYEKAVNYLIEVSNYASPSARCLYNLSVLYVLGEMLNGNTLKKDFDRAKAILEQIISSDNKQYDDENIESLFKSANGLLDILNSTNEYGLVGAEFHYYLQNVNRKSKATEIHAKVENLFNELVLPDILNIRFAKEEGSGDSSWFYFTKDEKEAIDNKSVGSKLLFNSIKAKCTAMSAWQIYLLHTADTILPLFWHAGYNRRKYIFSNDDLKNIRGFHGNKQFKNVDVSGILEEYELLPKVEICDNKATVTCCYWNNWKGLVRETVDINFTANQGFDIIEDVKAEIIYSYECGIRF